MRTRYGLIALTAGNSKVALVRVSDTGAWQFPSVLPARETERLEEQLEAALSVGQQQLGLDVTKHLCSQPVIHVSRRGRHRHLPPPPPPPRAAALQLGSRRTRWQASLCLCHLLQPPCSQLMRASRRRC